MEEFISFDDGTGKRVTAFITHIVGVSGTTKVHIVKHPTGEYEARMGIAILGSANMNEEEFKACDFNPFHKKFHDNYAVGKGATEQEAKDNLEKDIKETAEMLWAE